MKKFLLVVMMVAVLGFGGVAFAWMGGGGGPMWSWDQYYWSGAQTPEPPKPPAEAQKAFDETRQLRKDIHMKMFDYMEALRTNDQKAAEPLYKEINELRDQLAKKLGIPEGESYGRQRGGGYGPGGCNGQCGGYGGCNGGCR